MNELERTYFTDNKSEVSLTNPLPMQIADWLAERIFNGELPRGHRLKEEELASMFKTSRAPIREALYLLQLDGLVERLPRRGTVVREYSDDDIRDLYEVRSILELSTIDRLMTRWNHEIYSSFQDILHQMQTSVVDADNQAYSQYNSMFHESLFQFSGSQILFRLYQQLGYPLKYLLQFSTQTKEQMEKSYLEHASIIEMLHQGRFQEAKEILASNVKNGLCRVIESRHSLKEK
ncbi:GntR family transcriptional regulator [Alicyclobacillus sp. TC]|nr:GntR family transcriptional regulator [Alicyclobacillus sp. TC]